MNDQPIGPPVDFRPPPSPDPATVLRGQHVLLRPHLPQTDARPLFEATHAPAGDPRIWTYMSTGPYGSAADLGADLGRQQAERDPLWRTVVRVADNQPVGVCTYLAIVPVHGTVEIGNIWFAPDLQRTTGATEAIFLLLAHAFDLGYRRVEWKCDALNAPSRAAAERFGFRFEGIFAQHRVVRGRNRDTAWFAITDGRWPGLRAAFRQWLDPANFDAAGHQRRSLRELTATAG